MKTTHLIASLAIVACTAAAWFLLGAALSQRTRESSATMQAEVSGVWGPDIVQSHPQAWFETPNAPERQSHGPSGVIESHGQSRIGTQTPRLALAPHV